MSGAVFLSYASQDAEAARRICDALRAAGCEVWFDQSELAGGDAWDAKIRGQIRECALFLPLISANSDARLEGYFRREWKQAVERTHDMDESLPFLVPVVVDGTTDGAARVPEKFRHVQWTKLPGGEASPAFTGRVRQLLAGEPVTRATGPGERRTAAGPPGPRTIPGWTWAALAGAAACAALTVWRPWRGSLPPPAPGALAPAPAIAPPTSGPAPPGRLARGASRGSVAVLAFSNLSADKENEYLSNGISEDLIHVLARIPGLKVAARTSAFSFKGKDVPVGEIARQLGVAFVVEGSVQKAASRLRITAQLINASDGFQVWSDSFDRELKDIFALQDEIAGIVAQRLRVKLDEPPLPEKAAIDPEAFQLFLAGRDRAERAAITDLKAAIDSCQRAVALDPGYAEAWAQIARANIQLARLGGIEASTGYAEARKAVDKAGALEPDLPEVLVAQGWVRRTADWDWKGATQAFRRALELEPNNPETLADCAILLFNLGKTEDGIQLARRAVELDPLNAAANLNLCLLFQFSGDLRRAEQANHRAILLAPGGRRYHGTLSMILSELGRPAEARQEAALETDPISQKAAYAMIAVHHGAKERALALAHQIEGLAPDYGGTADIDSYTAEIYAKLNEKDRAFAALEHAYAGHDPVVAWIKMDTHLRDLHGDPRWAALLRKTGLSDEQLR